MLSYITQHALQVDAVASKRRHSNDINDIVCCQKYVLSQIYMGTSRPIHFISLQNTMHGINGSAVTDRHAWNFILMCELPF